MSVSVILSMLNVVYVFFVFQVSPDFVLNALVIAPFPQQSEIPIFLTNSSLISLNKLFEELLQEVLRIFVYVQIGLDRELVSEAMLGKTVCLFNRANWLAMVCLD